jgi:hypothetical protein
MRKHGDRCPVPATNPGLDRLIFRLELRVTRRCEDDGEKHARNGMRSDRLSISRAGIPKW